MFGRVEAPGTHSPAMKLSKRLAMVFPPGWTVVAALLRPAQDERVESARGVEQAGTRGGMHRRKRVARRIAGDDAALLHQRLGGEQAALAILEVDQRQPARVGRD